MANTSYTAATTAKLNREDLSDIISVVDAKATVLTSTIRKGKKPASALEEWIVDSYPTAKTGGTVDGTDVTSGSSSFEDFSANRARVGNYVQTFRRIPQVTRLQEIVANPAGINNPDPNGVAGSTEFSRAKAKATLQLKRDMEAALLSDSGAQADNGTLAFQTRGLGKWLSTTADSVQGQPTNALLASGQIYSGTLASFTEDSFRSLLQARWSVSGQMKDLTAIVGPGVKNAISDFTRFSSTANYGSRNNVRFFNQDVAGGKVTTSVDLYSGDYGSTEIFLSAFLPGQVTGASYVATSTSSTEITVTQTAHGLQNGASILITGAATGATVTAGFYSISSVTANTFKFNLAANASSTTAGTLTYGDNRGYVLDMDYLELRTALAPSFIPLPDQGGGPRGICESIVALCALNPTAHCKIAAY